MKIHLFVPFRDDLPEGPVDVTFLKTLDLPVVPRKGDFIMDDNKVCYRVDMVMFQGQNIKLVVQDIKSKGQVPLSWEAFYSQKNKTSSLP